MPKNQERFIIIGGVAGIVLLFVMSVCVWTYIFTMLQDSGPKTNLAQRTPVMPIKYLEPTAVFAPLELAPSIPLEDKPQDKSPEAQATVILLANPPSKIPFSDPPTPSPTAPSSNVEIQSPDLELLSQSTYVDSRGRHHIVGEVRNNGSTPFKYVEVIAEYYDDTNKLTGANLTFANPDSIDVGQVVPFDLVILRRPHWVNGYDYKLVVKGYRAEEPPQQNIVILNQDSRLESGFLEVSGLVKNTGKNWTLVKAVITLYDANNKVINSRWAFIDTAMLAPGASSPFEVKLEHQTDAKNYHYRIQIEEQEVSDPTILDSTPTPRP